MATVIPESTKRRRTTDGFAMTEAQEGATEVGQGLQVTMPRSYPHLYNNNYTVRLTYADNYRHDVAQTGATGAVQYFRMNSIFDPDVTGSGHQPMFRDMWASQYDYYTVLSCEYSIKMYNASGQDPVTYTAAGTSGQTIGAVNVHLMPTTNNADLISTGTIFPIAEMKKVQTDWLVPQRTVEFHGTLTPGDFIIDAKDSDSDGTWVSVGSNHATPRYLGYVITPAQWTGITGVNETPYSAIQVQVILNYVVQFTTVNQSLRSVPS